VDVAGCELASGGGGGNCTNQGIGGGLGNHIFKVRHDVDFVQAAAGAPPNGADPKLSPCAHLRAGGFDVCAGGTFAEEFAILSPIPHEIIARTAHGRLPGTRNTFDINGNPATNGLYLFPLGANLGGIGFPEFVEVNLDQVATPNIFEGLPWALDRRLSPNGCLESGCEGTPQPLVPFPFSGLDPRTQAGTPTGNYNDPTYTASLLSFGRDRILSFVDGVIGNFDGNNTTLLPANGFVFPPVDPQAIAITPITPVTLTFLPNPLPPVASASLSSNPSSPQFVGIPVTFIASAGGGSGIYEYQFQGSVDNVTWIITRDFGPDPTWFWGTAPGSYAFRVNARNAGNLGDAPVTSAPLPFVVNGTPAATGVTLTANPASPQPAGTAVTFVASGSGGTGIYEYQFQGSVDGVNFFITRDFSSDPTWFWGTAAGTFQFRVNVRSAGTLEPPQATSNVVAYVIN
jgi:hypothetical protein